MLTSAIFLSLAAYVSAQSVSSAATVGTAATVTTSGAAATITQAIAATTATASIDPSLPQTAATGPQGFIIPSLSLIASGATTDATVALETTYTVGYKPTKIAGAPALPTSVLTVANYPALDVVPPLNSTEVKAWIAAIDFTKVPSYNVTDGTCAGTPGAITDGRCWWTCGGCTRSTDITECPDKYTWGLSYDDGPSPYTPLLLDYLNEKNVTTTFFVVGSRVLSRPEMVQAEYASGHQISVHTWSHPYLTKLSNEAIVAELGWTKKVIKDTIGVTPNTFRPPYGDIDDRVRAIAAQMGLTPIIWTSITANGTTTNFDTTDWNIPGGTATGASSLSKFNQILTKYVPALSTGFIVLQHDLYQQTVDLAVGYVMPMALASTYNFQLKSIINCLGYPLSEAYIETSSNSTATQITTGSTTFYQPAVGTATGSAVTATGTGSAAVKTTGTAVGSTSATASSASTSKAAAGTRRDISFTGIIPGLMALGVVAGGMALVM